MTSWYAVAALYVLGWVMSNTFAQESGYDVKKPRIFIANILWPLVIIVGVGAAIVEWLFTPVRER